VTIRGINVYLVIRKRTSRLDRAGEATAIGLQAICVVTSIAFQDGPSRKSKCPQSVQDDSTETSTLADLGVNVQSVIVSTQSIDDGLLRRCYLLDNGVCWAAGRNLLGRFWSREECC